MAGRLPELGRHCLERVTGIEPALSAWEADVLPLNYTRASPAHSALPGPGHAPTSYRTGEAVDRDGGLLKLVWLADPRGTAQERESTSHPTRRKPGRLLALPVLAQLRQQRCAFLLQVPDPRLQP